MSGDLVVMVKNCTGLDDEDGLGGGASDPYVYLTIDGCDAQRTSTQEDRLNPEWNEELTFEGIQKPGSQIMKIAVYDDDTLGDDQLGSAELDLGTLLNTGDPQDFEFTVDRHGPGGIFGKATLYLSVTTNGWGNPPDDDGAGNLTIMVKNCTGLDDEDGLGGGASDPYVYLTIDGCDAQRTSTQEDRLNPEWNEELTFEGIQKPGSQIMKIAVYDDDTLGDDQIGAAELDLGTLLNVEDPQDLEFTVDRHGPGGIFGKATLYLSVTTNGWGNNA